MIKQRKIEVYWTENVFSQKYAERAHMIGVFFLVLTRNSAQSLLSRKSLNVLHK